MEESSRKDSTFNLITYKSLEYGGLTFFKEISYNFWSTLDYVQRYLLILHCHTL